ncbi:MAG: methyltransferase, TIGR04325 family [Rhodobacterales bacterium]|nr:methyltransferase, TIGR04325 family [Rhodobacterales bacterium]
MTASSQTASLAKSRWRANVKEALDLARTLPQAGVARMLSQTTRSTRFAGAYSCRDAAAAALARFPTNGYDDENIVDISLEVMRRRAIWDYPVLLWLDRLLPDWPTVLDAGGHLGTKYSAFSDVLDLGAASWTVYDLPGIVRAARRRQDEGKIPAGIIFEDRLEHTPPCDILLASGLLQYLDMSLSDLVARLQQRPQFILINKVALRSGCELHTMERIGRARVLYRIRERQLWEAEIKALGYEILDTWEIAALGHVISTHPWLGRSESRGYLLKRLG